MNNDELIALVDRLRTLRSGWGEVDEVLVPTLPDRLTSEQKRRKVRNLLPELRRAGKIVNMGNRSRSWWTVPEACRNRDKESAS